MPSDKVTVHVIRRTKIEVSPSELPAMIAEMQKQDVNSFGQKLEIGKAKIVDAYSCVASAYNLNYKNAITGHREVGLGPEAS